MKDKIKIIIFMIILGTISASLLGGINHLTFQKIQKNEELKLKSSVLAVLAIDYTKTTIEKMFEENIKIYQKAGVAFYKSRNHEIAFKFSGSGLWGPILGIIALKSDLETIVGIGIIHQEETPGLGGRISEKSFLNQFKNKRVTPRLVILPASKKAIEANEIDGITGATMTSKAFEELINKDIKKYILLLKSVE